MFKREMEAGATELEAILYVISKHGGMNRAPAKTTQSNPLNIQMDNVW